MPVASEGEKSKACKIAEAMLRNGMPIEVVAKYSGLTIEEIEKIK